MKKIIILILIILTVILIHSETPSSANNFTDEYNKKLLGEKAVRTLNVFYKDTLALVTSDNYLNIYDVSDPQSPVSLSIFNTGGDAQGIYVLEDYAYVVLRYSGMNIIDISDPENPSSVGSVSTEAFDGIYVDSNYAYICAGSDGLRSIDVSDPSNPIEIDSNMNVDFARKVYVKDHYAYIADNDYGLTIMDISDPYNVSYVSRCDLSDAAFDVHVSGNYAYVANYFDGMAVIDITNPLNPTYQTTLNTSGEARGIFVKDDYAYVCCKTFDLFVVDISNPANPDSIQYYSAPGDIYDAYIDGFYAFAAADESGLQIINLSSHLPPSSFSLLNFFDKMNGDEQQFIWQSNEDPCLDKYSFYVDDSLISNVADTFYLSSLDLEDGVHYWYVVASDTFNNTTRSIETDTFRFDATIPDSFSLISPQGYSSNPSPSFIWEQSFDSSFSHYELFVNDSLKNSVNDTVYIPGDSLEEGEYIWYVTANDSFGNITESNNRDTLIIDYSGPDTVNLINPEDQSLQNSASFIWHKGEDNLSGIREYIIRYDNDSLFPSPLSDTTTDTFYNVILPNDIYYWQVFGIDSAGNAGEWSEIWSFEIDTSALLSPSLIYPIDSIELEDTVVTFDWNTVTKKTAGIKSGTVYYVIEIDTNSAFTSVILTDTTSNDSIIKAINDDDNYYWRLKAYDNDRQSVWSTEAFIMNWIKPEINFSSDTHNFNDIDINKQYFWDDLIISNQGNEDLTIDSVRVTSSYIETDTSISYPLSIAPLDSMNYIISILSPDTGMIDEYVMIFSNNNDNSTDSINISAHCGVPVLIDSAKAFDGSTIIAGVDDDDFLLVYFNQSTNGLEVDNSNINSVFHLSNGHSWLDGFGELGNAVWNSSNNILMIEFTTNISAPTIETGDSIYPDSSSIIGQLNSFVCHYPQVISGNFGTTGINSKIIFKSEDNNKQTFLRGTVNRINYCVLNDNNHLIVYDICGKLIYSKYDQKAGIYKITERDIPSGIYFIKLVDGDKEINRKITVIK